MFVLIYWTENMYTLNVVSIFIVLWNKS